ncbi:Cobalt-zinc-cadmium resistance protein CzcC precursor [compost metagenome]
MFAHRVLNSAPYVMMALLASPAIAEAPLAMPEAVQLALHQNPEVRAAERQIEAARAREVQAATLPNPNLSLVIDQVPVMSPAAGNYMAGISQPLLLGGQREARIEAAAVERELAEIERDVLVNDLAAEVRKTFAQVLFAQEALRQARVNFESAQTLLSATRKRLRAGEVPRVEELRAEVEASRAQRDVDAANAQLQSSRALLNVLMGRTAQSPLALAPLAEGQVRTLPDANPLVELALSRRVELRQAELAIRREALQRRVAQTAMWTGTELSVLAGAVSGLTPGFTANLTVPIPLYRQQGEIAEAEANRARAEARRDALRNRITLEVEQAYRDAEVDARQVVAFRQTYVPQAERLADNARRRFEAGEGSGLEVIEARRALRESIAEYHQALLAYRQAITRLERAAGGALTIPTERE